MIIRITKCPNDVSLAESGTLFHSRGDLPYESRYKVIDKQLFFLAVIKYGIEYEIVKCSMYGEKDARNH